MIRTDYISDLKKGLAYPVDARLISDKLNETPLYDKLSIGFEATPGDLIISYIPSSAHKDMHPRTKRDVQGFTALASAIYSAPKEQWQLIFYPVMESYTQASAKFLDTEGLKRIRKWLESYSPSWDKGHSMYVLGINEAHTECATLHIHNERVVKMKSEKIKSYGV